MNNIILKQELLAKAEGSQDPKHWLGAAALVQKIIDAENKKQELTKK